MIDTDKCKQIGETIRLEMVRATNTHPTPMRSAHEGYAILKEETDELFDAIKLKEDNPKRDAQIEEEAYHVAAMSLRFLHDVVYKDE